MGLRGILNEVFSRITGFETPVGGVSWNPPANEKKLIQGLIVALEDRRVLYNDYLEENKIAAMTSVQEIREMLTDILQTVGQNSEVVPILRAMRAACRKYLDDAYDPVNQSFDTTPTYQFYQSLGAFRASMGINIARLCVMYKIEPEKEIMQIFPYQDE